MIRIDHSVENAFRVPREAGLGVERHCIASTTAASLLASRVIMKGLFLKDGFLLLCRRNSSLENAM